MTVPSEAIHERLSLGEAAYRQLRDDIISCRLMPSERLTERQLSARTGFGISPVREALTRLDHDGLVTTLPRKGYQVTGLTLQRVHQLFEFWRIIAPEVVRQGLTRVTSGQRAQIRDAFDALGSPSADPLAVVELAGLAFSALGEATGNDYLIGIHRQLSNELARVWTLVLKADPGAATGDAGGSWVRHVISGDDPDAAAEAARAYIDASGDRLTRTLARWPSVMGAELVSQQTQSENLGG